jgi:hypothetical protein
MRTWDLDNLIKAAVDAMEGIFGSSKWRGCHTAGSLAYRWSDCGRLLSPGYQSFISLRDERVE